MRSGRGALRDDPTATGVSGAPARDPPEAAVGSLQAGARRVERLAEEARDGAAWIGRDAVEDDGVRLHIGTNFAPGG